MLSLLNHKKNATAASTRKPTIIAAAQIINVANLEAPTPHENGAGAGIKDVVTDVSLPCPSDNAHEHGLCLKNQKNLGRITSIRENWKLHVRHGNGA